jgi:perosamine synthetase
LTLPLAKPDLSGSELDYVKQAIQSGWISNHGEYVPRFERMVALRHGHQFHGVACSSGTAALHLALLAAGIGRGDQVLVPDLTFAATLNTVIHVGAEPILVDVDENMCMCPKAAFRALQQHRNVKAIVPVFLYGNEPDAKLYAIANDAKLTIIEDRAEMVQFTPIRGHYACYSYYANKAITTGEGGVVVTRWPDAVRRYRDHGMVRPYYHLVPGLNYRLTNIAAALGCAQMERFDDFLRARLRNLKKLRAGIPGGFGEWLYVVPKRTMSTVETRPVFDPMHTMPYISAGDHFPNSIRFHRDYMCLPCGPHLTEQDIEGVVNEYAAAGVHRV